MSPLFRRRDRGDSSADGSANGSANGAANGAAGEPAGDPATAPGAAGPPAGPYDADDEVPEARRLDLGALRIPVVDGMQVQLEVDRASGAARSATVVSGPSRVRVSAFAAPRSAGVWDDVRSEISAEVTKVGGTVTETEGPFGTEIVTTIPTKLPDGRQALQVQRFAGVDGPRWFLRAVFSGPEVVAAAGLAVPDGAADPQRLRALEAVVRDSVVSRGGQARPPREPLPLQLPAGAVQSAAGTAEPPSDAAG
ncbi:MAG: DUF3710 domain-containing protein [Kineosporiaceae bacterium]